VLEVFSFQNNPIDKLESVCYNQRIIKKGRKQVDQKIENALVYLAERCDGAFSEDGQGFNKPDSYLGKRLAEAVGRGYELPDSHCAIASQMLQKYKGQLERGGLEVPKPIQIEKRTSFGTLDVQIGEFAVEFDYDPHLVDSIKSEFKGRRWNGECWIIEHNAYNCEKIIGWAEYHEFAISQAARELSANVPQVVEQAEVANVPQEEGQAEVVNITLEGDVIAIRFEYDAEIVKAVKNIPGRRWNDSDKVWIAPQSSVKEVATFAKHHNLNIADDVAGFVIDQEAKISASKAAYAEIEIQGLGGEPYPFQKAGIAYLAEAERALLGDEPGVGKTIQALGVLQYLEAFPALIVVPASLKLNWEREANKWIPGKKILVIQGRDNGYDYANYDLVIINYDVIKAHQESLMEVEFKAIICDESHYCKNPKSLRSKAVKKIAAEIKYRFLLTGTPVVNRPIELAHQLDIINRLDDLGGFFPFAKRYCEAYKSRFGWDFSGAAHLDELHEKMRASFYIRRTKDQVLKELPSKTHAVIPVEITNRREYEKAKEDTILWLGEQAEQDKEFLASIAHMPKDDQREAKWARRQEAEYKAAQAEVLVRINALRKLAMQGKLKSVIDWTRDFLESDEKLIIFAHHIEAQDAMLEEFPGTRIQSKDDSETRQANVDRFQDGDSQTIVCSLKAAGVGLTLTASSNVLFVEQGWTPADMDQATDRTHRIGQDSAVTAWHLLAKDTIDEDMYELIEKKRQVVDAVTDGVAVEESQGILNELVERMLENA
jgi:SWI/SNF-related matrix-associated actin-dependent regulator of chromatin subfamily A-like protein 1